MKKLVLILAAVLMIVLPAAAYDFGGSLDASASVAGDAVTPAFKATAWAKVPFETGALSTEAYYKGTIADEFTGTFDVSLLKLSLNLSGVSVNIGRYAFSDVTSSVFATTSDGVNLAASAGLLKLGAYVGYTGLLNAKTSSFGAADATKMDDFYPLSNKYVVFLVNAAAPNFLGGNTFTVEGLGAIDMNDTEVNGDTFCGTVSAAGPVTDTVYYSASATGSFGDATGLYAKGSITAYLPVMSMSLGVNGTFGSDDFKGITCSGGMIKGGVSATAKPLNSLLCLISADYNHSTILDTDTASWNAQAKWQAMTDVSAYLSLGQNIPLSAGDSSFNASFGATLSF